MTDALVDAGYSRIPVTPVAAPRMVRSDRWRGRTPVLKYFEYKDHLRSSFTGELAETFEVIFVLPMPESWPKKQRRQMIWTPHRQRPDTDNLLKAFKDALCEKDERVYHDTSWKFWGNEGCIYYRPLEIEGGVTLWDLAG